MTRLFFCGIIIIMKDDTSELHINNLSEITKMGELKSYKLIVELAQDAIFIKDLESRYILVNQKTLEALGNLPREEVLGKNDYELLPADQAKANIEDDQKVFTTARSVELTKKMTAGDKEFYFQAVKTPLKDENGKVIGLIGIARDVTEGRRAVEGLQASERKFRDLFDSANDGILLADAQSKKFYTGNKKICQMLGYSLEEIKNLGVRDIHPEEDLPYVIEQFEKQLREKISVAKDIPVKRKDGSIFYADINGSTMEIDGTRYLMGLFRDVSERKQAEKMLKESEAKLREQKLSLEQKNIALSEIIKQIEIEKDKMKDDIATNVNKLIFPLLAKLKTRRVSRRYADLLQHHLEELTSSFGRKITAKSVKLTPREIEICSMVKGGLTSKEISDILNISYQTIEKHRKNIRHKLGLSNKDINLTSFLHTL